MIASTATERARARIWLPGEDGLERLAMGGPGNRKRTERLSSTVLGRSDTAIRCPRVLRIGLDFGKRDPVRWARHVLRACGYRNERAARAALGVPPAPRICRPDPAPQPAHVDALNPEAALYQAILLGLCTQWLYDPARPVLWTHASLTRRLELFEGEGFYA